ncbi:ABC transporter substrate-binding protein [Qingshengfaniella alkalisoli]|uniref:ABC transporter substrate-binding protein n=1 Tax=Qingshengfaniella alkalisoli TaxID=2599296 RepID=A0A5B8IAR5_9RHOB|nr:ABC transporter substrate-binding protein [Qingshengfaniella alkalisoli]QDY70446.1 ABC transporter substrate-binding protein [Qingshengfaniella alkalisoli]
MTFLKNSFAASLLAATAIVAPVTIAHAETVLRLDEVAVGELDPAKATDTADSILMFNVYDTLVLPAQGGPGYAPHLAESWTQDGTELTFVLRDDVSFQSGNPLTAEDVVFSLERMKALGAGLSYLFDVVDTVEAVDTHTVKFSLTQPYSPFIASLVRLPIIDKALVMENLADGEGDMGDWGQAYLSGHSAGSGAYSVTSHNPQDETVMAKADSYFLDVPAAAPDTVRLRYSLEAATVRTLVSQGEHDIASQWLPPEVIKSLADDGAQLLTEGGSGAFYLKLNTTKPPLDDVNCRQALAHAFDYSTALRMVAITPDVSLGRPSTGAIPVGMFGANGEDQARAQDMDKAKEYLDACQYDPAEMNIEVTWIAEVPLEERFALLFQSNLNELGIKSEIRKMPWALFTEAVAKPENTPHVSQLFVNAVTGDPDTLLYGMYHSSAAGTWQSPEYLNDAEVDQYLEEGRKAETDEAREVAYSKLNARLLELAPTIYAYDEQAVFAASDRVSVPALSDDAHAFGLDAMGFTFRLMEMTE